MPTRYADRRLDTEEFAKIMNIELLRIALERSGKHDLTWELTRTMMVYDVHNEASIAANKLMEKTAESLITPAVGGELELQRLKARLLQFPPRSFSSIGLTRSAPAVKEEPVSVVSQGDTDFGVEEAPITVDDYINNSSDDGLDTDAVDFISCKEDDPLPIRWSFVVAATSKVHLVNSDDEPLCPSQYSEGNRITGEGLLALRDSTSRPICKACIRCLDESEQIVLLSFT
jgi:hypothetical protein